MTKLHDLAAQRQSVWLHFLRRSFIQRGQLRQLLDEGIQGVVLDPATVARAVAFSSDYDERLNYYVGQGKTPAEIVEALLVDDVQRAADILQGVYDAREHSDGFVVLPLDPELAHNEISLVASGRHLGGVCAIVDRPNFMLGIPATRAGIGALRQLIADGCNVYASHVFSASTYEAVAGAYLDGIEEFFATHSVWRFAPVAVAAVALATIDNDVDAALSRAGRPDLKGRAAIALARVLYARHRQIFTSPRWLHYERAGAHVLRLAWADSAPADFAHAGTAYANALVGPGTVQVMAPTTLFAFRETGTTLPTLATNLAGARDHLETLKSDLGINLLDDGQRLQEQALTAGTRAYRRLEAAPALKRNRLETGWQRLQFHLGSHQPAFDQTVQALCDDAIMCRIWENDNTVWNAPPGDISSRLRWLHLPELMAPNVPRLEAIGSAARNAGFDRALVITGGSTAQVAQIFAATFGALPFIPGVLAYTPRPHLQLSVVDTANRDAVFQRAINAPPSTLFVFISPGDSPAAVALFDELLARLAPGPGGTEPASRFLVVTAPGSPLADAAATISVHDRLLDPPALRGPYTALSFAGLLPAALTGLDLDNFLEVTAAFAANASGCNCPLSGDNAAAQLGAAIAAMAGAGLKHVHLIAPPLLAGFAGWASSFASTALAASGVRMTGGPPPPTAEAAGHFFIHLRPDGDESLDHDVANLRDAGHPVAVLHVADLYELGGFFFLWQMAVAVAAHRLGCNPFDGVAQPVFSRPPVARAQPA